MFKRSNIKHLIFFDKISALSLFTCTSAKTSPIVSEYLSFKLAYNDMLLRNCESVNVFKDFLVLATLENGRSF